MDKLTKIIEVLEIQSHQSEGMDVKLDESASIIQENQARVELANQNNQGYKYEIWHYPSGKQFIFIDEGMFGNFRLYREIN